MNDIDALKAGYTYQRLFGMHKGQAQADDGSACILGALSAATKGSYNSKPAQLLNEVAKEQFPERLENSFLAPAAAVNDHPDTTFEDVAVIWEKAIVRAEEWL